MLPLRLTMISRFASERPRKNHWHLCQTRFTNRLTSALKDYFPHVLDWFEDKAPILFCAFFSG